MTTAPTPATLGPGALVRYRERDWLVLPSYDPELILLRPVGGSAREVTGVVRALSDLMGYTLPYERITSSEFPLPDPGSAQDHSAVKLLQQAARLLLRDGAAPFRSLGNLSLRPRPYQYVPLLMALRLPAARLLIADDVGVGKTIEAGLVAREMLDRGEIRRIAVLCPPYLCDQWQRELAQKFSIEAVVVRSGTIAALERQAPHDTNIFAHYPHIVASIDTVKSERYQAAFVQFCPEFLIVDEVHGAAAPPGERRAASQQQRHDLVTRLAADPARHLLLLSATPHSGVESSFLSILGLLRPEFARLDLSRLPAEERIDLARHFVQRRRADVRHWMGEDTPFPERDTTGAEQPYTFTREYRDFYNAVYGFARDLVRSAETLSGTRQRMRFWSALALLRCVSSSPAAARVALQRRLERAGGDDGLLDQTADDLDAAFAPLVYDPADAEAANDAPPATVFEAQDQDPDWGDADRRRLRDFARMAATLEGSGDAKREKLVAVIDDLLRGGYRPIVWCRYIATADYVAAALNAEFERRYPDLKVTAVTGALSEDERRLKIEELSAAPRRILVATDCLSEGINLQEHFNAVIHYDLPWNPNRLEQREGRVDRFGQPSKTIKAVLIFGGDNPVDGAVLDVLLRKAREIYSTLGVSVPLPMDSETVMTAVLQSLFSRLGPGETARQMRLFDQLDESGRLVRRVHEEWTAAAAREQESRTRFAQRAIKPEEVAEELRETDRVLGSPDDARRFVHEAAGRLGFGFRPGKPAARGAGGPATWLISPATLPPAVGSRLGKLPDPWPVSFDSPPPEGATYIGRAHPLVEALAEHLVDLAFHPAGDTPPAARTGVIRTAAVTRRTTLWLLRLRYLQYEASDEVPALAEETLVWGFGGAPPEIAALEPDAAAALLDNAAPALPNVTPAEKRETLEEALGWWPAVQPHLAALLDARAAELEAAHRRVRRAIGRERVRIAPRTPPDLLGVVVLLPVPKGIR